MFLMACSIREYTWDNVGTDWKLIDPLSNVDHVQFLLSRQSLLLLAANDKHMADEWVLLLVRMTKGIYEVVLVDIN